MEEEKLPGNRDPLPLTRIVKQMHEEGDFLLSLLVTEDGLPVTTAPRSHDSESTAALVAMIQDVVFQSDRKLLPEEIDEMTLRDRARNKLVCRLVYLPNEVITLAALVPPDQPYRRVTNRAIRLLYKFFH